MMVEKIDRLFVPLKKDPFEWFQSGKKKWELRGISNNFNPKTVIAGRCVELRKGYNGPGICGKIIEIKILDELKEIPRQINYKEIIPKAKSEKEFFDMCTKYVSKYNHLIVFKIKLN